MKLLSSRWSSAVAGILLLVLIAASSFALGRWLQEEDAAEGRPDVEGRSLTGSETAEPGEEPTAGPTVPEFPREDPGELDYRDEAIEAEFAQPRFSGVVNGIEVGTEAQVEISPEICAPGNSSNVAFEAARGTVVDFRANYLPGGAELASSWAVECQGNYILTYAEYSLSVPEIGAAVLQITRFISSNRPFSFDASAGRVSAGEINARPAVLVEAVIPGEGYGPAGIAISEEFGMTLVTSINLTLDELRTVAEGLE